MLAPLAGSLIALSAAEKDKADAAPLAEMEVKDVLALEVGGSSVVILQEKGKELILPIFIGPNEALAIDARLKNEPPPRPMTHDLLEKVIRSLGAQLTRVHIDDLKGNVYYGRLYLTQGARKLELDARPSDSIALALGAHVPIFAARKVLDSAGLTAKDLERMHEAPRDEPRPKDPPRQQKL